MTHTTCWKKTFHSHHEAQLFLNALKWANWPEADKQRIYECHTCHYYHTTSQPQHT